MEDYWKALHEKGVAVAYVGTTSVISSEIVCISNFYIYIYIYICYISAQEDKEDYDNSDTSLKDLIFWQLSDFKKIISYTDNW